MNLATALLLAVCLTLPRWADAARVHLQPGDPAPAIELTTAAGDSLAPLPGEAAVVIFLRGGQQRSEKLLAALSPVQNTMAADGIRLMLIASRHGPLPELPKDLDARVGRDVGGETFKRFGVVVTPTTVVVGSSGEVVTVISSLPRDFERRLTAALDQIAGRPVDPGAFASGPPPEMMEARRLLETARSLDQQGNVSEAVEKARKAVALVPEDVEARILLGELLLSSGDGPQAQAVFAELLTAHPKHPAAQTGMGRALAATGATTQAVEILLEATRTNPNPVHAHYALGRLYERQGAMEKAVEQYQRALTKLSEGRR